MGNAAPSPRRRPVFGLGLLACWLCGVGSGCAALTNPVADGIPVRHLPPELRGTSRAAEQPLPLSFLRQKPPDVYQLEPGDVLGVWIEGVLGAIGQPPPVRLPERGDLPPALGYPIPVREDGTLALPLVDPIPVRGLSLEEAQKAILKAYVAKEILKAGRERVIVTLMRRRQYHVLVFRDNPGGLAAAQPDFGAFNYGPEGISVAPPQLVGTSRSTGYAVDLPAYENDVLDALAQTGGLPGVGSVNEILVLRGYFKDARDRQMLLQEMQGTHGDCRQFFGTGAGTTAGGKVIRIPLRLPPGQDLPLRTEDIILQTGDIVYLPPRTGDVFYAGGLLPSGEYILPRDRDLDVVEAVMRIRGPLANGGVTTSNLSGAIVAPGIGGPSPSLLTVVRRMPGCGQLVVRVDLNRALRDPRERLLVQPGDYLILQETPTESVVRYITEKFGFTIFYQFLHGPHESGALNAVAP